MSRENEGILMQRVRNQLRIHWGWLKAADAINAWMRQALSRHPKVVQQLIKDKDKNFKKWANQKIVIECNMLQVGDLMDILFMADGGPFDNHFRETLKLNNMNESYQKWLDKMINIVCKEEFEDDSIRTVHKNKKKIKG
jgi:hypothetical protein